MLIASAQWRCAPLWSAWSSPRPWGTWALVSASAKKTGIPTVASAPRMARRAWSAFSTAKQSGELPPSFWATSVQVNWVLGCSHRSSRTAASCTHPLMSWPGFLRTLFFMSERSTQSFLNPASFDSAPRTPPVAGRFSREEKRPFGVLAHALAGSGCNAEYAESICVASAA